MYFQTIKLNRISIANNFGALPCLDCGSDDGDDVYEDFHCDVGDRPSSLH